jgi:hypothetical protein
MYLVMLAYSLLMGELRQGRAKEWALHRLSAPGKVMHARLADCTVVVHENHRLTR